MVLIVHNLNFIINFYKLNSSHLIMISIDQNSNFTVDIL